MKPEDGAAVVELERACNLSSRGAARYQEDCAHPATLLLVATAGGGVIGAFSGWVVAGELMIDNLAVGAGWRRQGVGSRLLLRGLAEASRREVRRAVLEVRSWNLPARLLYERHGFETVGRRRNYYRDPDDDALIMVWEGGGPLLP